MRLHRGGELAHEDALSLGADELELIAQGPDGGRWLLLECPFEGLDDEVTEAAERLWDLGYGVLLAHPERAAAIAGADRRLHTLARPRRAAPGQRHLAARPPRRGRLRGRRAAAARGRMVWCLASDGHPGTRDDTLDRGYEALLERPGRRPRAAAHAGQPAPLLRDGAARSPLAA